MRILLSIVSFNILMSFVFLFFPQIPSFSQESNTSNQISNENPITVYSNTLELDQEKKLIVFEGRVRAQARDIDIDCQKMLVYYLGSPENKESNRESGRIDKIIALGDVVISRPESGTARAGKAVFYQNEGKVVLTGNPCIRQGPDSVEGQRIIIFLNENRSIVEGGETKRVKATIFPKEEKGE